MRIAIVHYKLSRSGGMESYLADLVRGFAAAGDTVEVWAGQIDRDFAATLPAQARRIGLPPLPRLLRTLAFSRAVRRLQLQQRHELVISLARTRGQDLYINGGTHPGFLEAMARRATLKDRIEISLERGAVESSACTIAHSRLLAGELQRCYGAGAGRVRTLYPPIDSARFVPLDAAARRQARAAFGLAEDDYAFLFPSMGHERKGLSALLQAFARLDAPHALLLVAGRLIGQAAGGRVRELGYVKDMPALYAAADCTVLPSRYEPFGLVIAESLQCGTPAIAGAASGVAELMGPDDGIRLQRCDADEVLQALRRMLEQRCVPQPGFAQRHGLQTAAHVAALRRLTPRATVQRPS
jgi:glycosyltransferase involved in cell wall biosynthesis